MARWTRGSKRAHDKALARLACNKPSSHLAQMLDEDNASNERLFGLRLLSLADVNDMRAVLTPSAQLWLALKGCFLLLQADAAAAVACSATLPTATMPRSARPMTSILPSKRCAARVGMAYVTSSRPRSAGPPADGHRSGFVPPLATISRKTAPFVNSGLQVATTPSISDARSFTWRRAKDILLQDPIALIQSLEVKLHEVDERGLSPTVLEALLELTRNEIFVPRKCTASLGAAHLCQFVRDVATLAVSAQGQSSTPYSAAPRTTEREAIFDRHVSPRGTQDPRFALPDQRPQVTRVGLKTTSQRTIMIATGGCPASLRAFEVALSLATPEDLVLVLYSYDQAEAGQSPWEKRPASVAGRYRSELLRNRGAGNFRVESVVRPEGTSWKSHVAFLANQARVDLLVAPIGLKTFKVHDGGDKRRHRRHQHQRSHRHRYHHPEAKAEETEEGELDDAPESAAVARAVPTKVNRPAVLGSPVDLSLREALCATLLVRQRPHADRLFMVVMSSSKASHDAFYLASSLAQTGDRIAVVCFPGSGDRHVLVDAEAESLRYESNQHFGQRSGATFAVARPPANYSRSTISLSDWVLLEAVRLRPSCIVVGADLGDFRPGETLKSALCDAIVAGKPNAKFNVAVATHQTDALRQWQRNSRALVQ